MTEDAKHASSEIHKEHVFEEHIATSLEREQGYLQRHGENDYNSELALDTASVRFLKTTQPTHGSSLKINIVGQPKPNC